MRVEQLEVQVAALTSENDTLRSEVQRLEVRAHELGTQLRQSDQARIAVQSAKDEQEQTLGSTITDLKVATAKQKANMERTVEALRSELQTKSQQVQTKESERKRKKMVKIIKKGKKEEEEEEKEQEDIKPRE